jgi:DNA-binding transcriptional LysR family regulator
MPMEMRHLRYFIAVAEEGHITRAAERLGMQQPPLSQQIKAIERELDVQLFRRRPRGVALTEAGRAFLDYARDITAHLDRALETTRRTARGEQGQIRVGITPTSPFNPFVPRVIRAFRETHPLIALTLTEYNSGDLIELLRNERLDAAFIRMYPAAPDGLVLSLLVNEAVIVALPEQHRLAKAGSGADAPLALRSLADETIIVQGGLLSWYTDVVRHAARRESIPGSKKGRGLHPRSTWSRSASASRSCRHRCNGCALTASCTAASGAPGWSPP